MSKGHIKLGATGDLRDYILVDPMQYHAGPANPMAPRLNTGEKYAELTGWAEWVQQDWPAGVGRSDPNVNGYLYGDLDSRVSGQLLLPPALGACHGYTAAEGANYTNRGLFLPADATAYATHTMTASGDYFLYTNIHGLAGQISTGAHLYARLSAGASVTVTLYKTPDHLATATLTGDGSPYFQWLAAAWTAPYTLAATGTHSITIQVNSGTLELACGYGWSPSLTRIHDGDAYRTLAYAPLLVTDWYATADGIDNYYSFTRVSPTRLLAVAERLSPHQLYLTTYNANAFGLASSLTTRSTDLTIASGTTTYNGVLQLSDTKTITVADGAVLKITDALTSISVTDETKFQPAPAVQFDGYTYLPVGDGYGKIDADGNGTTETPDASLMRSWAGYLWRADGNTVYYATDGATWEPTAGVTIGGSDFKIRGLAGLDKTVYVATDEGLFYVGDGDICIGVSPWGTLVTDAVRAVNYEAALYLPVAGRVLRYTSDGSMLDVWVQRADDLPADKLGAPAQLAGMNQWLVAAINPSTSTSAATVWAWQTEGWHPLATLPPGLNIKAIYYDRTLSRLWLGADHGLTFWLHIDDYALNPYNSPDSRYQPYGWLETPRFYGDLKKIDKDCESIFITGEFPTGTSAAVYFQSDQTATWTLLGTVTADNTELRWTDAATRPTGKWVRLGLLLATADPTLTPKIRALVLKYMPMVMDRERWQFPILVASEQEMLDATQDPQTQAQKLAHLRSLIRRVAPFTLEDMDGTQYEVKVVGANRSVYQYAVRLPANDLVIDWIYTLSLEQVTGSSA